MSCEYCGDAYEKGQIKHLLECQLGCLMGWFSSTVDPDECPACEMFRLKEKP